MEPLFEIADDDCPRIPLSELTEIQCEMIGLPERIFKGKTKRQIRDCLTIIKKE